MTRAFASSSPARPAGVRSAADPSCDRVMVARNDAPSRTAPKRASAAALFDVASAYPALRSCAWLKIC